MGLAFRIPNDRDEIIRHGGVVIATNSNKEILITLLPTGELHGYPITAPVYKVVQYHSQDIMSALKKRSVEDGNYTTLGSREVLIDAENKGIISKYGDFNYYAADVDKLVKGTPKEFATSVPGLAQSIKIETSFLEEIEDIEPIQETVIVKTKPEPVSEPVEKSEKIEQIKTKLMTEAIQSPLLYAGDLTFENFIHTILSVLNKFPAKIVIQETEPGIVAMILSSPIIPEMTFTGTIKELASEFVPTFLDAATKKKANIDFAASLEKLIEKKREEASKKASDKKKDDKKSKPASKIENDENDEEDGEEELEKPVTKQKSLF